MESLTNLISVIIPTYNRQPLLAKAITSVLTQTYSNFELIIVDDCSTDATESFVKSLKDKRIRYTKHNENKHVSASRNTGIRLSRGEFIAFLDDDDHWLPNKLVKQLALLKTSSQSTGLIYCWMDYIDKNLQTTATVRPKVKGNVFEHVFDKQGIGGCPTLLVKKSVIADCGGFDETLLRGNDGDFIRRICLKYQVDFIPEVLVKVSTEHGNRRISDNDITGIKSSLFSYVTRLEKFSDILTKYPSQTSNIYASIAYHHALLGNKMLVFKYIIKSILINPLGVYKYRIFVKTLKDFFYYNYFDKLSV